MREETSPPPEPQTNPSSPLVSPCIKLTPSPTNSPNGNSLMVMMSPSVSRRNSPSRSSPSSTIVPSPTRCSPNYEIEPAEYLMSGEGEIIPKYLNNNKINRQNLEKTRSIESIGGGKSHNRTEIIVEETSHVVDNRKGKIDKYICDCTNQNCVKCVKVIVDKNVNNNFNSNVVNNNNSNTNTLTVNRANLRGKFRHQSSSQGSFEGSSSNSPCLSRGCFLF